MPIGSEFAVALVAVILIVHAFGAESGRIRTGFRGEAEHDSGMIPNSVPG
jgi:hypothetical protein